MATATIAKPDAETYDGSAQLPNPRQEAFANFYLIDSIGKNAYISAGYSKKGAEQSAHRMLNHAKFSHVQKRIQYLQDQRNKRARKTADEILEELENIGFSNVADIITWNESGASFVKNSEEIPRHISSAIESIQVTEDQIGSDKSTRMVLKTSVKLYPKVPALLKLGGEHGLFKDKVEMGLDKDLENRLAESLKRGLEAKREHGDS